MGLFNTISTATLEEIEAGRAIYTVWDIEDVFRAWENQSDKYLEYELTEEEAKEILAEVDRNYCSDEGINWEIVENYTREYIDEKLNS